MQISAEIDIRSNESTSEIVQVFREFSSEKSAWNYDESRSKNYSLLLNDDVGFVIAYDRGDQLLGMAFCETKPKHIKLANITPKKCGRLPISEYNEAAVLLCNSLKVWCKKHNKKVKLSLSNTNPDIEEIITANIPRKAFEDYLSNHPRSSHPLDIMRLDKFICSVAKYSRKNINWEHLGKHLQERYEWSVEDVEYCINRINIGLDVIKEYKRF